jgi:hypothetical protein
MYLTQKTHNIIVITVMKARRHMHIHTAFKKGSQQIRAVTEVVIGDLRAFEGAREIVSGSVYVGARMSF